MKKENLNNPFIVNQSKHQYNTIRDTVYSYGYLKEEEK